MRNLAALAVFAALLSPATAMEKPSFHTKGTPVANARARLRPGEYWWNPDLSPRGPVVVLVSIPQQLMYVYRNGILIGRSTVSTGSTGHSTPPGVFSILEKKETHYSRTYDNAPMPNMQRLTWNGIAMHSGNLPGYAASHGCVRLPYDFSQLLFRTTSKGGTVIIGNGVTPEPRLAANPGVLLAPTDFKPEMLHPLAQNEYDWRPERSPSGPVSLVLSSADHALYVYRNGEPIGRGAVELNGRGSLGESVFTLLEGGTGKPSLLAPGREARRWLNVTSAGRGADPNRIISRVRINQEFAGKIYDSMAPGATVVITDQPVVRRSPRESAVFGT